MTASSRAVNTSVLSSQLLQEAQQQNASPAEFQDRADNQLRDMIDQQLLISKGKELGITGDAETMRQLDDIRKQNHINSMEELEKAAGQQGVSFEDFKQRIRNQGHPAAGGARGSRASTRQLYDSRSGRGLLQRAQKASSRFPSRST